jgi:acetyl-CoA synthetase
VLTFAEVRHDANRLAHALRGLGIQQGDRVALCMPLTPEVLVILYACMKAGFVVVPIFSGFGPGAIATRLADSGARVVFTADALERRGKRHELKAKVDQAVVKAPAVEAVVVQRYRVGDVSWNARDRWWDEVLDNQPDENVCEALDSEATAFILYTSGTTGKPKGAVHTHAGCLAQMAKEIYLGFDHRPEDRFFWLSDIG